jgi:HSP20 family protein
VTGNILTIKGERKSVVDEKKKGYLFHETSWGHFERSLTLPEGVDASKVHATCKNGVLELTMPTKAEALPKKVSIEIEGGEKTETKKAV